MSKPVLLDLFCCEGGAAMGYHRAGFEVIGVDIKPQKRYPFAFVQADALNYLAELVKSGRIRRFAAIHASPPCQEYSALKSLKTHTYPDLLAPTRDALMACGVPWIMENVATARMHHGVLICGTSLGLNVRRHRRFDSSHLLYPAGPCRHGPDNINVYGHNAWNYRPRSEEWRRTYKRTNAKQCPVPKAQAAVAFEAPWMSLHGLAECVPPAYTEWLGRQLIQIVRQAA